MIGMAAAAIAMHAAVMRAQAPAAVRVIPAPSSVRVDAGAFTLRSPVHIAVPRSSVRLKEIADLLASVIRARTGFTVRVGNTATPGAITIDTTLSATNTESYELTVSAGGVAIRGASAAATLWGVQTLRQLLPPEFDDARGERRAEWTIAAVSISDAPRFQWRGSLVDVGRHFFPVAAIKKHIDVLSRYKMNVLHWHLTEDQGWRIEIRKYPRLTSVGAWRTESDGSRYGGFYTQKEIRDVVEYARQRGVTVMPEIEMPGHSSAAIASYPELGCTGERIAVRTTWGVFADIYCAGDERVFTFLTDVLDEVLALFPSRYIHIGGDEVPKERWQNCASCQAVMRREGLANEEQLQAWFIKRIGTYLESRGRKLVGWDEVLEGGLFAGATAHVWRDTSFARTAIMSGHDIIASPNGWTYLNGSARGLPVDRVYAFDPVPPGLDSAATRRILGGEGALWSEHITSPANLDMMAFPRMLALSEVLWSALPRDSASFHTRLDTDHIPRLRAMRVAVGPKNTDIARISIAYDTSVRAARVRTQIDAPGVVVRATADGSAPRATSPVITDSAVLNRVGVHRLQPFFGGERILAERTVVVVNNAATGRDVTVSAAPSRQYPGTGARNLTDGLMGGADHADGLWQGWIGADFESTLDLGAVQPVNAVRVTFLQNVRSWILFPARAEFSVSDDGATWRSIGEIANRVTPEQEGVIIQGLEAVSPPGTRARFVKIAVRNGGRLPAWHPGAGRPSWVFADEIVVR